MTQAKIDWEQAWKVFWNRYEKQAPRMYKIQAQATGSFEGLWKAISPVMGSEDTIAISFDKEGGLRTTMAGFILIGAIAAAGARNAIEESKKALDDGVAGLDSKWEKKLQDIENRLGPIEEDIGIKRPPIAEEKANP